MERTFYTESHNIRIATFKININFSKINFLLIKFSAQTCMQALITLGNKNAYVFL